MTRYLAIFVFLFANFTFAQDKDTPLVSEKFNLIESLDDVLHLAQETKPELFAEKLKVWYLTIPK